MRLRAVLLLAGIAALTAASPARAATAFKVSGTTDGTGSCTDGVCTTLRAALAAAATGDTIQLPTPKPVVPYQANSALILNAGVTIRGSGAQNVTVQGGGKARVFIVAANQAGEIDGVTIANGAVTGNGGNVLVNQGASLTLDHVRVTGGTATRGAGIAALGATKLTIRQSLIDGNTASGDGGGVVSLGDVKVAANQVTLSDSTIALNHASSAAGVEVRDNPANVTTI